MPSISVFPPVSELRRSTNVHPLPRLLQTPSGLALLELQGSIHLPPVVDHADEEDTDTPANTVTTPIGKLLFPSYSAANPVTDTSWMKHVYLYVGKHQRLTGEVKKLPKPMGIMRKRVKAGVEIMDELEIVEVVRHKIVFSQRPEPVGDS